jgi:hypothetical protein
MELLMEKEERKTMEELAGNQKRRLGMPGEVMEVGGEAGDGQR